MAVKFNPLTGLFDLVGSTTITANRAAVSSSSGGLVASSTTDTQIGYLNTLSSNVQTQLNGKESSITSGTTSQYWRGDKTFQNLTTSVVTEGSHLYYTDARARNAISASSPLSYNATSGALSLTAGNLSETGSSIFTVTGGAGAVIGSGATIQANLADTKFYVGNSSGYPVAVNMSGDATLANTG